MAYEIPYADPITEEIDLALRAWDDLMEQRKRFDNRAVDRTTGHVRSELNALIGESLKPVEDRVKRALEKLIRAHPMADWLAEQKTQGARVATILATIRHPHRFPSQKCTEGHHLLPTFNAGEPCPCETTEKRGEDPKPCVGTILPPRETTGCRALWHMLGLYPITTKKGVVRLARFEAGVQGSHSVRAKTAILMPQGIAQQFYMQAGPYAEVYYREKARLAELHPDKAPGWLDGTARVIAAKAWAGDLLTEWKRRVPLEKFEQLTEIDSACELSQRPAA